MILSCKEKWTRRLNFSLLYEIIVIWKAYCGYFVSGHLLPSRSTEMVSQFLWVSEGFPLLLWNIHQQNRICNTWVSRIHMAGFVLLNKVTDYQWHWGLISTVSSLLWTYLWLYRTLCVAFSCGSELLFAERVQAFLILLHFPLSRLTDGVFSSTSRRGSPPAKRLLLAEDWGNE